jgi:hypothetical protein
MESGIFDLTLLAGAWRCVERPLIPLRCIQATGFRYLVWVTTGFTRTE